MDCVLMYYMTMWMYYTMALRALQGVLEATEGIVVGVWIAWLPRVGSWGHRGVGMHAVCNWYA